MSEEIDFANLPEFPKRIAEKLKTIRKRLNLSPDQLAARVGAKSEAEILAYENNEGELPVSVLWAYARLAGNPIVNFIDDKLEINWTNN
jgi:transcriptional regulator with XRE-family HTH domain